MNIKEILNNKSKPNGIDFSFPAKSGLLIVSVSAAWNKEQQFLLHLLSNPGSLTYYITLLFENKINPTHWDHCNTLKMAHDAEDQAWVKEDISASVVCLSRGWVSLRGSQHLENASPFASTESNGEVVMKKKQYSDIAGFQEQRLSPRKKSHSWFFYVLHGSRHFWKWAVDPWGPVWTCDRQRRSHRDRCCQKLHSVWQDAKTQSKSSSDPVVWSIWAHSRRRYHTGSVWGRRQREMSNAGQKCLHLLMELKTNFASSVTELYCNLLNTVVWSSDYKAFPNLSKISTFGA